jgi:hypothetical protein
MGEPSHQFLTPLPSGTIADLTTAEGTLVDPGFLNDQVSLLSNRSTDLEIIQERPSTPGAWTAWRKACSLWGKIDQPLGPWKFPSVSLRRSWPYHWDAPTGRLWIRTPDEYSSHRPFSRGPRGLGFHRHSINISNILPDSCFPLPPWSFVSDSPVFPVKPRTTSSDNLQPIICKFHLHPTNLDQSITLFFTTPTLYGNI